MSTLNAPLTVADVFRPQRIETRWLYNVLLIVAGSLLIAGSAWVEIVLPFTPVPITGQTFAVLLVGALYGSKRGAATVLTYLAQGAAGLPVFAGGAAGAMHLLGPTGGYLIGFVIAVFVVGLLAERGWDRTPLWTALAMMIGTALLFFPGVIWLMFFVGPHAVLMEGLIPYIPGAIIKISLAAGVLPIGWKALERLGVR